MYCLIGQTQNQVKFMNTFTEHILQCNQSEPLADASGRIADLMNENANKWMQIQASAKWLHSQDDHFGQSHTWKIRLLWEYAYPSTPANIDPLLVKCWANVADDGSTLVSIGSTVIMCVGMTPLLPRLNPVQEAQGPWRLSTALQNFSYRCVRECITIPLNCIIVKIKYV